ncbi:MAG: TadE/TadG family type IV pilus assembly protein [Pseudobdellovibrionaceae bacterium]
MVKIYSMNGIGRILTPEWPAKNCKFVRPFLNQKGQVAIFVALVFQILFVFFAMVINIGLLVHQKVNLQNSVDIAAFYAAQKQAENLNAIAHINYQIRQSWKLLAWRYRQLGTASETNEHPFSKETEIIDPLKSEDNFGATKFYEQPAFCMAYRPFNEIPANENPCKKIDESRRVPLAPPVPVVAGFSSISKALNLYGSLANKSATERCKIFGVYNYLWLGYFARSFNYDQANRNALIAKISKQMSKNTTDFYDLDGDSVLAGVKKNLEKNLTLPNKLTLSDSNFEIFNSLASEKCNSEGAPNPDSPPKWLSVVKIAPGFFYVDTECGGTDVITIPKEFSENPKNFPAHTSEVPGGAEQVKGIAEYVALRPQVDDLYNYSIGVEKNPWCMAYVGVKASTTPSIPFLPFGNVKLTAKAFAKPFGGRIGPWYNELWPESSPKSAGGQRTDELLPPRFLDFAQLIGDFKNPTRFTNYSRYVGDKVGIKSNLVLGQIAKGIYSIDSKWKTNASTGCGGTSEPCYKHWDDLQLNLNETKDGDILAWDSANDRAPKMRELEIAAIAPDAFDLTYYSIEPDFYGNYFKRLEVGIPKMGGEKFPFLLRSDLGARKTGSDKLQRFSIIDQVKTVMPENELKLGIDLKKLSYISQNWESVLTGWNAKNLADYSINDDTYGKCKSYPDGFEERGDNKNPPKVPNPGNCISSFTGYSVQLVSRDYLNSKELTLGGESAGAAGLKNPPPDKW